MPSDYRAETALSLRSAFLLLVANYVLNYGNASASTVGMCAYARANDCEDVAQKTIVQEVMCVTTCLDRKSAPTRHRAQEAVLSERRSNADVLRP